MSLFINKLLIWESLRVEYERLITRLKVKLTSSKGNKKSSTDIKTPYAWKPQNSELIKNSITIRGFLL